MLAVDPHSMSTVPLATSGMRVAEVTGVYATVRSGMPSFAFTASTTRLHSSIEKPTGRNLSSRYGSGIELSRWPTVKVPVSFTFFNVPSGSCAFAGANDPTSRHVAATAPNLLLMTLAPADTSPSIDSINRQPDAGNTVGTMSAAKNRNLLARSLESRLVI